MKIFCKNIFAFLFLVGTFSAGVSYSSGEGQQEQNPGEAEVFVNDISEQVLSIIKDSSISDEEKEKQLRDFFEKYVNTGWMGKFVLGRYYRAASESEISYYNQLYHEYLMYSYVPKFREYKGTEFYITKVIPLEDGESMVQTEVRGIKDSPDVRVDYRIRKDGDGFYKVIDIVGEGISLITTQRSDFGGLISQKGVSYFLDMLEKKVKAKKK